MDLFLHSSPVAYWAPTNLGSWSFSVIPFCLFILFMGFSKQEYWSGLPFPSPVDHILLELSTMTNPSWVALHGMAHSFTESARQNYFKITLMISNHTFPITQTWISKLQKSFVYPSILYIHMTILNTCTCRSYSFLLQKHESQIVHCNVKKKNYFKWINYSSDQKVCSGFLLCPSGTR